MKIRKKSESFWKQMKMNHNNLTLRKNTKCSTEREVHSDSGLSKKDKNISNKNSNTIPTRKNNKDNPELVEGRKKQDESRIQ